MKLKEYIMQKKFQSCRQDIKKRGIYCKKSYWKELWKCLIKMVFPKEWFIKDLETINQNKIVNGFNKFIGKVEPKLSPSVPDSSQCCKDFINITDTLLHEGILQVNELKVASNSLKFSKSPSFDEILPCVVKFIFYSSVYPLKHVFSFSIQPSIFRNGLKITRISPIFKL